MQFTHEDYVQVRFFEASPLDRKSSDEYTAAVVEQPKLNVSKLTPR